MNAALVNIFWKTKLLFSTPKLLNAQKWDAGLRLHPTLLEEKVLYRTLKGSKRYMEPLKCNACEWSQNSRYGG